MAGRSPGRFINKNYDFYFRDSKKKHINQNKIN